MRPTLTAAILLGSALLTPAAMAQVVNAPAGNVSPPAAVATDSGFAGPGAGAGPVEFVTRRDPGVLRASDLLGEQVYGTNNEDIGEVEDVLIDRNGQIVALVVEVGGFLGIGERRVAVPPQAIRLDPLDMTATTGTIEGQGLPPSTAAGAEQRDENRISRAVVPERIVLTVPVDQLRAAPAFVDND